MAPFLKFHMDEDLKKELEMLDLLRKVSEENAELDRKRQAQAASQQAESEQPGVNQPEANRCSEC